MRWLCRIGIHRYGKVERFENGKISSGIPALPYLVRYYWGRQCIRCGKIKW